MFPLANINFGNLKFADILGSDDISYIVPPQPANDSRTIEVNESAKSEDGAKNASQGYVHVEDSMEAYSYEESKSSSNNQGQEDAIEQRRNAEM